jgi:hypothetical protein
MKAEKKLVLILLVSLIAGLVFSCTSTGEYMPLSKDETVIGTVQANFETRSTVFLLKSKSGIDAVNKQAYIKLMEAAGKKYSGNIDIRDIVWVTGRSVDHEYTEVSASGKVVQMK